MSNINGWLTPIQRIGLLLTLSGIFVSAQATTDCSVVTEIPKAECEDLMLLYNNTSGLNWSDRATNNWNVTNTPCSWTGITCLTGHVIQVVRDRTNLSGSIPDFQNLAYLQILYLTSNPFLNGTIPNFSGLPRLEDLVLMDNRLTGAIPDFDKLPKVRNLRLHFNRLTGTIPDFHWLPNMSLLDLSHNQLTGSIPDFGHMPYLRSLYLTDNKLSGSIPNFSRIPLLWNLALTNNPLSGSIPDFSALKELQTLFLQNDQLTGTIPTFSNSTNLQHLYLENNQLSGSIPDFQLPKLMYLYLGKNQLTGPIPNFSGMENLRMFSAFENQLSGAIPQFTHTPYLQGLWFTNNQLSGALPDFKSLPNLWSLRLSYNQLTGTIPDLSGFPQLAAVSVDHNQLCGEIPASLAALKLSSSVIVEVASNHLTTANPTLITFLNKKDPGWEKTQTPVATCTNPETCLIYGLYDDGKLNDSQFFTINPDKQFEIQLLGPRHVGYDLEAMDIQPQTRELYASSGANPAPGLKPGHLYRVNQADGTLTPVCNTGLSEVSAMSFQPRDYTLWVWANGKGLFTIDFNQIQNGVCQKTEIIASKAKVKGFTWNNEGSVLYGATGTVLYKYEKGIVTQVCNDFPPQTGALEMLADGLLLFSSHNNRDNSIHSFDLDSCSVKESALLPMEMPYADVESLIWKCSFRP